MDMSEVARTLSRIDESCTVTIEVDVPVREGGRRKMQTFKVDIKYELMVLMSQIPSILKQIYCLNTYLQSSLAMVILE